MLTALAFLGQAVVLAWIAPSSTLLLSAALMAFTIDRLWWMRTLWNPHIDMLLIMLGWGGLGMLLGPLAVGAPACHASPAAMWAGMLTFSAWPSYRYARCLRTAYHEGRLPAALAFDIAGMAAGMLLAETPFAFLPTDARMVWLQHGCMLAGMTLGMALAMRMHGIVLARRVPANG